MLQFVAQRLSVVVTCVLAYDVSVPSNGKIASDGAVSPPGLVNSYRCVPPLVSVRMPAAPRRGVLPNAIAKPPVSVAFVTTLASKTVGVVKAAIP